MTRILRRGPGLCLGSLLLVGLLVVLPITMADGGRYVPRNDPAVPINKSPGERLALVSDCVDCHRGSGWNMPDIVIVYPEAPIQLRLGEPFDLPVHIINPWSHRLQGLSLEVILRGERQVLAVAADASTRGPQDDQTDQATGTVGIAATHPARAAGPLPGQLPAVTSLPINLEPGGRVFHAAVSLLPHGSAAPAPDEYDVYFLWGNAGDGGTKYPFTPSDPRSLQRTLHMNVTSSGAARIIVEHRNGYAGTTEIYANFTLVKQSLDVGGKAYRIPIPANATIPKHRPPWVVPVRLQPFDRGTQELEFRVRAEAFYAHDDRSYPSRDNFTRAAVLNQSEDVIKRNMIYPRRHLLVGDAFVPSPHSAATVVVPDTGWPLVAAELAGFAAAGLLVPSLVLGGTYGRASRRLINDLLGGAKRRVMYHSLLSLGLSLVALVHTLLFLWEGAFGLTVGVLWGGFGALSLLVLGLTGYYQVPLIQRRGFAVWRSIHLAAGLAVIAFVALHTVLDGRDFAPIRAYLPGWLADLNIG